MQILGRDMADARLKILIVDDEDNVRRALQCWFERANFEVHLATDGLDAVEKCHGTAYDVITMDLEMPRMSGLEAITKIRSFNPAVPIVVLTGYSPEIALARDSGAQLVLNKPVSLRELEKEVRALL